MRHTVLPRAGAVAGVAGVLLALAGGVAHGTPSPTVGPLARSVPATAGGDTTAEVLAITARVLPITAEVESIDGSRAERETSTERTVILTSDVLFAFDSADLTPDAVAAVEALAAEIRDAGTRGQVRVDGHTDDQGGTSYNLDLSRRRAEAVAAVLQRALDGAAVTLVTEGHGANRPRVPNADADGEPLPENQQRNRRVEITVPVAEPSS